MICTLTCPGCGYTEQLVLGVGMAGAVMEPMRCTACNRVVAVQVTASFKQAEEWSERGSPPGELSQEGDEWPRVRPVCPECGGEEVEPWDRRTLEHVEDSPHLPAAAAPCPRCGHDTTLAETGIWD